MPPYNIEQHGEHWLLSRNSPNGTKLPLGEFSTYGEARRAIRELPEEIERAAQKRKADRASDIKLYAGIVLMLAFGTVLAISSSIYGGGSDYEDEIPGYWRTSR